MKFFNILLIVLLNLKQIYSHYPTEVLDSQVHDKENNVYKFDFKITYGMSMAIQNMMGGTYDPVFYNTTDQFFYQRDPDQTTACNKMNKVTDDTKRNTIVGAAGIHKPIILINNMFPGPPIVVEKDALVEVTVHNNLFSDIVNIHWHGQVQKDSFFMDGVPHVTECPINPGSSFTYKFRASNVGTHWYHAHTGLQRSDGLYGPFIVKDTPKKRTREVKYDKEFFVILQDWDENSGEGAYTTIHWRNFKFFHGYNNTETCFSHNKMIDGTFLPPVPFNTILINGKGWNDIPRSLDELKKNAKQMFNLPLESYHVEANKRYLFRIVSASSGPPFEVSVSGHHMTLVATDGNPIKPIENIDSLVIHSGERYDFVLDTKSTSDSNYFLFAKTLDYYTPEYERVKELNTGLAIIKYRNSEDIKPDLEYFRQCSKESPCKVANCFHAYPREDHECISADKFESLMEPNDQDKVLFKTSYSSDEFQEKFLNFHFSGSDMARASTNNFRFKGPNTPPYFLEKSQDSFHKCGDDCVGEKLCQCTHVLKLKPKKVVQLVFLSMGIGSTKSNTPHPIHLHGHHFYVMKMGFPNYDNKGLMSENNRDINCPDDVGFCNQVYWTNEWQNGAIANMSQTPVKKDTIFIPMGGYAVVRFLADNIGFWFLHCHIENHMAEGMTVLIQEGSDEEIRNKVDWKSINTCERGYTPVAKASSSKTLTANFSLILNFLFLFFLVKIF